MAWHPHRSHKFSPHFQGCFSPFGIFRAMRASVSLFAPALAKERKGARGTFARSPHSISPSPLPSLSEERPVNLSPVEGGRGRHDYGGLEDRAPRRRWLARAERAGKRGGATGDLLFVRTHGVSYGMGPKPGWMSHPRVRTTGQGHAAAAEGSGTGR